MKTVVFFLIASLLFVSTFAQSRNNKEHTDNQVKQTVQPPVSSRDNMKQGAQTQSQSKQIKSQSPNSKLLQGSPDSSNSVHKSSEKVDGSIQRNVPQDQGVDFQSRKAFSNEQQAADIQPASIDPEEVDVDNYDKQGVNPQKNNEQDKLNQGVDESVDGQNYKPDTYHGDLPQEDFNTLGDKTVQNWQDAEKVLKNQQDQSIKEQLGNWIAEQMNQNEIMDQEEGQGIVMETFQVALEDDESFNFRWNPPKSQSLHIKVMIFEIQSDGGLLIMRDNQQDQWLELSTRQEGQTSFKLLAKIYIDRTIKINFDSDYKYFKLQNRIGKKILAMVDLQKLQEVVNPKGILQSDHFSTTVKKLQSIRQEIVSGEKLREHTYKYQWGFLDNQYSHDSRLLGLTGLELILIIGAAIVQIYFIKSLLDNRAVV